MIGPGKEVPPTLSEWKETLELVVKELKQRRERSDSRGLQPPTTDHACEKCESATMVNPGFLCGFHQAEKLLSNITEATIKCDDERRTALEDLYQEAHKVMGPYFEAKESFREPPPMPFLWRRVRTIDHLTPTTQDKKTR